ncbi:NAD(P)/FAD-dependent oxidoreductase [Marinospirillum alkaliphilum]|uniref:Gamma-glutamylputrescine oxidase n=1 Tax=Marinospirillum alkaliphilum DSM 21637 TaxID=1122209 RepID=A0A1K1U347_9GAMM|nr:FAD-binding oxidoreductase [Marinospirillum alkaliphilum]SFX07218.1 gamma-glutamylputrescine oxidase [Marinospirillum alkaliphilum DSM 21637]
MTAFAPVPSYYAASANPTPSRPHLSESIETQVCVIGAGYTGLSTALFLAEAGFKVVILEAATVGWGASGRNGGQMVNSYSRDLDVVARQTSADAARLLGQMAFEGGRIIRQRVKHYGIQCDLQDGAVFAALNPRQMKELEHQKKLWESHGYDQLELLDKQALQQQVNTERYIGGSMDHGSGHIHPLNLALGEAAAFESLGGVIYEHSAVVDIQQGQPAVVKTAQGVVKAEWVVVAGNAYLGKLLPQLASKSMPCGTQVLATEPLGEELARSLIPRNACIEDCNYLLDYYRLSADHRLIYGGGVVYGARDPVDIERLIRPKMLKTFPQLQNVKVDYTWTGNFLLTLSRLPQMGRIGSNVFYSQGCSGHGVTFTHVAGQSLALAIQGQTQQLDAFASLPHYPFPGGRLFQVPFSALGAWYYDLRDKLGI